jgi:hypothetical protein
MIALLLGTAHLAPQDVARLGVEVRALAGQEQDEEGPLRRPPLDLDWVEELVGLPETPAEQMVTLLTAFLFPTRPAKPGRRR